MNVMRQRLVKMMRYLFTLLVLCLAQQATAAKPLNKIRPVMQCSHLTTAHFENKLGVDDVTITSAKDITTSKGEFCQVKAKIAPAIEVEVSLPQQHWTQRLLQVGCGGLCGEINLSPANASGCLPATHGEFVVAATNMGHNGNMMDASWGTFAQQRIDFAYRANHLTAMLAKALIKTYYGQAQQYAYFMGCSDGGREALMEAQRYPKDFNGISAGAPAAFFQFQNSFFHGFNVVANQRADGSAILLKDKLSTLHQAVIKHCPTLSGINDGILANPFACHFSSNWVKTCNPVKRDKTDCLTTEEISVAEKLYRGAYDSDGNQFVLAGLPLGSELRWPVPSSPNEKIMSEMMALPALQSILLPGGKQPFTSMKDFPLTKRNFTAVAELAPLYNAANTNLRDFMQHNGKLILWHGLADDSISPAFSIAYYRGVEATLGESAVQNFMRLFLLPGVAHCGAGEGFDQVDLLTPLMDWTEQNLAPNRLVTGKAANGQNLNSRPSVEPPKSSQRSEMNGGAEAHFHGVQRTSSPLAAPLPKMKAYRPVYPYPYIAVYNGEGSIFEASNFHAVKSLDYANLVVKEPASLFIGPDNQKNYTAKNDKLKVQP